MVFSHAQAAEDVVGRVRLPQRSLLLFEGDAYTALYHSIASLAAPVPVELGSAPAPSAQRRVSITMRCVAASRAPMHTAEEAAELARRKQRWFRAISER